MCYVQFTYFMRKVYYIDTDNLLAIKGKLVVCTFVKNLLKICLRVWLYVHVRAFRNGLCAVTNNYELCSA